MLSGRFTGQHPGRSGRHGPERRRWATADRWAGPTIHPGRLPYGRIACARGGVAMDDHYVTLRPCYPDGHAAACPYVNPAQPHHPRRPRFVPLRQR